METKKEIEKLNQYLGDKKEIEKAKQDLETKNEIERLMQDLESKKVENQDQPPEGFRDDNSDQNEGGDLEDVSTDEEEREESLQAE